MHPSVKVLYSVGTVDGQPSVVAFDIPSQGGETSLALKNAQPIGDGGAAHLAGVTAALTALPVLGVPIQSKTLSGLDSLLSIVQMPAGVSVGTLAIGEAGAANAGLLAAQILSVGDTALAARIEKWRAAKTAAVPEVPKD